MKYHLAIDLGASGGRHILGCVSDGKLVFSEVHRFGDYLKRDGEKLTWDTEMLFSEIVTGLKKCAEAGKIPETVAIDTWGVDYVLLDKDEKEILPVYSYRDDRTSGAVENVEKHISAQRLYELTGMQKMRFNTVYQLFCDKESGSLEKAEHFLMMPEYLSYKLTGIMKNEYTIASTSGMINAEEKDWDKEILVSLGYPEKLFKTPLPPCTEVGSFSDEVKKAVGFDAKVVFCPSHDTASAVAGCPLSENDMYISSGTWSLIGIESPKAFLTDDVRRANFTNEGGIEYRFRFLKNYVGMWLLQSIRRDINKEKSYDEMMFMAENTEDVRRIDVNDDAFLAPDSMVEAIRKYLNDPALSLDKILHIVYHSLAESYKNATEEIEKLSGKKIETIRIVGGGSKDKYLNALTEKYTGKKVAAGPTEATATGNLISQLIYSGECKNLDDARELVKRSFVN